MPITRQRRMHRSPSAQPWSAGTDWYIFGPGSNEYDTAVSLQMDGPHQGWATMSGTLTDHSGMYDVPGNPA